jgi:hypothetical protein
MATMSPNHYCEQCGHFEETKAYQEPCHSCDYLSTHGFTNWKPIQMQCDVVSKPKHYILMDGLEVRDVLATLVAKIRSTDEQKVPNSVLFETDYVQMMQYLMRFMDKNGKQDLEKARWYLDKLIAAYE